jgi:hypothetical protein
MFEIEDVSRYATGVTYVTCVTYVTPIRMNSAISQNPFLPPAK